jgi:hypothetical protein
MRNLLTLALLIISTNLFSQARTNCGPNIGYVSNTNDFKSNTLQFGFSVRSTTKWRYAQAEVNLGWNPNTSEFSEMRIPVLFGAKILNMVRINIGGELRSTVTFIGENKRGMNALSYKSTPNFIAPVIGCGLDVYRLCFDFRITTQDKDMVNIKPQYTLGVSYLFGPRKAKD